MALIQYHLGIGYVVNGCYRSVDDPELFVDYLDCWGNAICGAGRSGNYRWLFLVE